jgi:hypothetical protein
MAISHRIDDMKSLIGKRGGIARGNRYGVQITHPLKNINMHSQVVLEREYEKIPESIFEIIQDGRDTYMLCSAVSLPGKRISTTEATHNHNLAKKPYSMATDEVSMTFLLTNDYYIKKYFDLWQELIVDSTHSHYKTRYKKEYTANVTIQALDSSEEHRVGYATMLENAYPIQISQVELGEGQEGLMEVTVTWEYDNWRMIDEYVKPKIIKSPIERLQDRENAGRGFIE